MSARRTGKKQRDLKRTRSNPDKDRAAGALYLYCIGIGRQLSALLEGSQLPAAIEDGRLELIEEGELAAVVSRVSLDDYGEEPLNAHLNDAAWLALRAMRHERVVDYFATRVSVVPLRFGTIYLGQSGVEKMLAERAEELHTTIERFDGRQEWGVNIFCDRKALMDSIASISPRLRELNEQAAQASPGQAYLVRKKMDSMRTEEARAEIKRSVERIKHELQTKSRDGAVSLHILKDEAGEHGELIGKLAFLIERERFGEFRLRAEQLAGEYNGSGIRLELTGPWPAYNFVASK